MKYKSLIKGELPPEFEEEEIEVKYYSIDFKLN